MISQVLIEASIHDLQKIIAKWSYYIRCLFCLWLFTSYSVETYLKVLQTTNYINKNQFTPKNVEELLQNGFKFQVMQNLEISYTSFESCFV